MDLKRIESDWHERGFSCDLWTDPPGQIWEDFVHSVDELLMVVEGTLEIEMQGKLLNPEIGEEIFIPADVVHSVRNVGGTTSRWLYGYKRTS
ncbi:cupin domain-containing protein [Candidatus Nitromaritima sp. SCGC AAA799-A02]|nr:cupin domain-containing protein [Candidatus Nitromaritima sp. SCGC AAA799-A02]